MDRWGVVVGCDKEQEWMLPWWWEHYSAHNKYPVAFADFGMSEEALAWCRERGECLVLPAHARSERVEQSKREVWESCYGTWIWKCRGAWFKKPLALLSSPFSRGLWIDLDCQINGSVDPIFHALTDDAEIGLAREPYLLQSYEEVKGILLPEEVSYNAGVVLFKQGARILQEWAKEAIERGGEYPTDQHALSRVIYLSQPALIELPQVYNWLRIFGPNSEALIYHFTGGKGKAEIKALALKSL
ncbi:MAG: hypothetical protein HYX48_00890 [Chlamydiales bacterium]|nr:hypothetical protein [Chlamydiales bacterium]